MRSEIAEQPQNLVQARCCHRPAEASFRCHWRSNFGSELSRERQYREAFAGFKEVTQPGWYDAILGAARGTVRLQDGALAGVLDSHIDPILLPLPPGRRLA